MRDSIVLTRILSSIRESRAAGYSITDDGADSIADLLDQIIPNVRRLEAAADALAIEHACTLGTNIMPYRLRTQQAASRNPEDRA